MLSLLSVVPRGWVQPDSQSFIHVVFTAEEKMENHAVQTRIVQGPTS